MAYLDLDHIFMAECLKIVDQEKDYKEEELLDKATLDPYHI
jgi:hypothetical protein